MCGIAGYVSLSSSDAQGSWLHKASVALSHRGPDDEGMWQSGDLKVGLAHRRLAIRDLSPLGAQPMASNDGSLRIVFNGEIYNFTDLKEELVALGHSFRSQSDTEVLLAAYQQWGEGMLSRLNGMFAFAIFDAKKNQFLLARDRAGEKPLYYSRRNNVFTFASELGSLAKHSGASLAIDQLSLEYFLAYGYAPPSKTLLSDHFKLPPASFMRVDLSTLESETTKYWYPPSFTRDHQGTGEDLVAELQQLLSDSVNLQLAADVPVGVLLSGGLDSSVITALAAQQVGKVNTFTVSMDGSPELDESNHAKLVADYFGTNHQVLTAKAADASLIESIAIRNGEPIADSSIVPTYLVTQEIRKSCTVALGGDGGDELFGGYPHYQSQLDNFTQSSLRQQFSKTSGWFAETLLPTGFPGRNSLMSASFDGLNSLPLAATHFDYKSRRRLLSKIGTEPYLAETLRQASILADSDIVSRSTRFDFEQYLTEDILVKVDRASMMNSLEMRAPFLDFRIIEFAFGKVPADQKVNFANRKILLKNLAQKILPPEFDYKRKQGFSIPLAKWLKQGSVRDLFWSYLNDSDGLFNPRYLSTLLRGQDLGFRNSERLFALLQFEIWRREMGVSEVKLHDLS